MNQPIEINLCNIIERTEIDYTQSAVKLFFDQKAACGNDGKKLHACLFFFNVYLQMTCTT